jgi:FAD/FMN-containing dehydrogenase
LSRSLTRRDFLKLAGAAALAPGYPAWASPSGIIVNDVHSQLNETTVSSVTSVDSFAALKNAVKLAAKRKQSFAICGGRHAGGGQQFASAKLLVDTRKLNRVLHFDSQKGLLEVESGINWPELLAYLHEVNEGSNAPWGVAQKQTGTDILTIGGTLSANAHGQGLTMKPFVGDIESFLILDAQGKTHMCSRDQNTELFRLAIGGYGLFGVVYSVTLRLKPRLKVERIVDIMDVDQVIPTVEKCIASGYPYGDFQFNIDERSDGYLKSGIFSAYRPVDIATALKQEQKPLSLQDWFNFVEHAHVNKRETFERFVDFYQKSSGFVNWSDVWQTSTYLENYHSEIDRNLHLSEKSTEVLTEIYVPRSDLPSFIEEVRADFLKNDINLIYSTIRFIARDDESFLPWAKDSYACVIFNLHTVHTAKGIADSAAAFRRLIDLAIKRGGSYYLTYHKFATKEQVLACYPKFQDFLKLKQQYDPGERFCSNWYQHCKEQFLL